MPLSDLTTLPPAVTEAAALIDALDDAFLAGFGRLGAAHLETLAGLCRVFAQTPLGAGLTEAVDGLSRSEFIDRHFLVLAAARASLQGAMHDALLAQACAALDRAAPKLDDQAGAVGQAPPPQAEVLMESTRHWLMELAIAGLTNLEVEALLPFQSTLDAIEGEPSLVRQAALLGGLLGELLTVFPCGGTPEVPRLRWVDLWSRAMILAARAPEPTRQRQVSGELRILGSDLRQHSSLANLVLYASLHESGAAGPRLCRVHVSAFKVDVIQGDELGALLGGASGKIIAALAGGLRLQIKDMPILPSGDLLWDDGRATLGAKGDPLAEAAAVLTKAPALRPCLLPADRHPALIDELVYLPASAYAGGALPIGLDVGRMADSPDLVPADLQGSKGMVALLRCDGGAWTLQPIATDKGKGARLCGSGLLDGQKKTSKGSTLATLKERAGKLLRKK